MNDLCTIAPHDNRLPEPVFYCNPKTGVVCSLVSLERSRFPGYWVPCHYEESVAALSAPPVAQESPHGVPDAWQWRKRLDVAPKNGGYLIWTEWEPLVPPYMDARDLAKSDPQNYELRALYASPHRAQAAPVPEKEVASEAKITCDASACLGSRHS